MKYKRMAIEAESPEQMGYDQIKYNLSESSVADRGLRALGIDLNDLLLCYGDHRGSGELRAEIAQLGTECTADDVLVTAGAAGALFIIGTSLLERGSHVVVLRPNYAINIECLKAIDCEITYLDLSFEEHYELDLEKLANAIRPETKLVSLTYPHNPTGVTLSQARLREVVTLIETMGCTLLFDETYREMTQGPMLPTAADLSSKVISVSSLSKTYGIPGIRLGWIQCLDPFLMERFLCAKELIGICGSVVDEAIGLAALRQRDRWIPENNHRIHHSLGLVRKWVNQEELVTWVEPRGGCISFPRIRAEVNVDLDRFYRVLFKDYHTYVGPGHWFEQTRRSFRIGHAWPTIEQLETGLAGISHAIRDAVI